MAYRELYNQLPPYRPYDYKIDLKENAKKALKYSPLYKISILKLEAVKAYLIDNLNKGYNNVFIIIDRFSKQAISIPYNKKINIKETAKLYIYHIFSLYKLKLPNSIKVYNIFHPYIDDYDYLDNSQEIDKRLRASFFQRGG
ncbi:unnamed protein product [Diplocarpon coronariae]